MSSEFNNEVITPIPKEENELIENESYSCTECSSNIEILSLDDINNIMSFKCPIHGTKTMTIKDYLNNMKINTFLYSKCETCKKQQNEINNNEIFNYCTKCQLIICNKCIINHDKDHFLIKNDLRMTRCKLHPKNINISYCLDCNCHVCKECLKHRKHMKHNKQIIDEIEPSYVEIKALIKVINEYKTKMNNSIIEKNNKLVDVENKYNEDKEKETLEYHNLIINNKKKLEDELKQSEDNYNYDINEIKIKYEKELKERKDILNQNNKLINDKYKLLNDNNKVNYDKKLDILEKKYKNDIKKIENLFKEKINHLK